MKFFLIKKELFKFYEKKYFFIYLIEFSDFFNLDKNTFSFRKLEIIDLNNITQFQLQQLQVSKVKELISSEMNKYSDSEYFSFYFFKVFLEYLEEFESKIVIAERKRTLQNLKNEFPSKTFKLCAIEDFFFESIEKLSIKNFLIPPVCFEDIWNANQSTLENAKMILNFLEQEKQDDFENFPSSKIESNLRLEQKISTLLKEINEINPSLLQKGKVFSYTKLKSISEYLSNKIRKGYPKFPDIDRTFRLKSLENLFHAVETRFNQFLNQEKTTKRSESRKLNYDIEFKDEIPIDVFRLFLVEAGTAASRKQPEKIAQLKLIFILLYYLGIRINELHSVGKKELYSLMDNGKASLTFSTGSIITLIPKQGQDLLKQYKDYIILLFEEKNYKTLTCSVYNSKKPMDEKQLIRLVNKELARISKQYNIQSKYSSDSFKKTFIKKLVKANVPRAQIAELVGKNYSRRSYDEQLKMEEYLNRAFSDIV